MVYNTWDTKPQGQGPDARSRRWRRDGEEEESDRLFRVDR